MKFFAHYIKRRVVDSSSHANAHEPPYVDANEKNQGFEIPVYHSVAINSGVAARVERGDFIWLFSQLSSPWGSLPPSLDGMIEVADIEKDKRIPGRYRFDAGPRSRWFPLLDARKLLKTLKAVDARGVPRGLLEPGHAAVGQALQFLREIEYSPALLQHAAKALATPSDFVSYRIMDGTEAAFRLVRFLENHDLPVFWDRWSLPRKLTERKSGVAPTSLDSHIIRKISGARAIWGVSSKLYGAEGSYSRLEKELAIRLGTFRPYPDIEQPRRPGP